MKTTKSTAVHEVAPSSESIPTDDSSPISQVIASLTKQQQRENKTIVELMERQRSLRKQLLQAQERSLVALRHSDAKTRQASNSQAPSS